MDSRLGTGRDIYYNDCNYMEPLRITKIVKVGSSLGVIVPVCLLEATNLKRGDQVNLAVGHDNVICIKKVDIKIIT